MSRSFFEQSNDRRLPESYSGDIHIWDIDKTYLDTQFSSLRGLLSIPFELAIDKQAIPGTVPLLRALRHGPRDETALVPLYFISGSPTQLRGVIERKMTIDGVEFDGITFKDQLGLLFSGRGRDIKRQVGYKLEALLSYAKGLPRGAKWILFGDDTEDDAEAFALFGNVCAGMPQAELEATLVRHHVDAEDRAIIHELAPSARGNIDPIAKIFIHLEHKSDPARFTDPRVAPTRSYLQTALVLAHLERIRPIAVGAVAKDLRLRGFAERIIAEHIADAEVRLGVPRELCDLARRR